MTTQTNSQRRSNLGAMLFHFRFDDLHRAYRSSMSSYDAAEKNAEARVRELYDFQPDQPFPAVEYDPETGDSSMDWGELIGEFEYEAVASRTLVRTAFVIALFHFWERETNVWQGLVGSTYKHSTTMQWLTSQGGTPKDHTLRDLELSANCAKHGPGRSCIELYARRPDLYGAAKAQNYVPHHDDLEFTDDVVETFFEAVKASGPRLNSSFV